jgi:hypothetical protein
VPPTDSACSLGIRLVDPLGRPFRPLVRAIRLRQWEGVWLGVAASAAVTAFAVIQRELQPGWLSYTAETPWRQALVRIPLSVVAPALHLPYWGAVLQVLVVLSCAQPVLGVRRTLGVGLVAHVAATLVMREMLHAGGGHLPGLWRTELDSGPSVAVLAIGLTCALVTRSDSVSLLVVGFVAVEVVFLRSMASLEHAVGVCCGLAAGLAWRTRTGPESVVPDARSRASSDSRRGGATGARPGNSHRHAPASGASAREALPPPHEWCRRQPDGQ